ncbi:HTH_Tnp_Tc3_2 domain-containing protein [Trichonephila clavipes]|nr:HTH_Tnp_Tc3_2 domain-containing protein [Trichonephila clavipes]
MEEISDFVQSIPRVQECDEEDVETWMACDAEYCGFQMLNDDEIMTSVQEESIQKLLGAVDTRRYPRAENRVWSDQEDHEERGSKDRVASTCGPHSDLFYDTSNVGVAIVPQTISRHLAEANLKSKRPFRAFF